MQCKQHLQHSKNGPKIARNSQVKWKLFKHIKTDDSSFTKERNRVDQQKRMRKKKKGFKKNMNDTPYENNINTVDEEHFSSENY